MSQKDEEVLSSPLVSEDIKHHLLRLDIIMFPDLNDLYPRVLKSSLCHLLITESNLQ